MNPRVVSVAGCIVAASLSVIALGCGEDLASASEIVSLRVLGVQADTPFAAPGSHPRLQMLVHDGAPGAAQADSTRRNVQIVWMEGCLNPPGNLYYLCYPVLHAVAASLSDDDLRNATAPAAVPIGFGTDYQATIPQDAISGRPVDPQAVYPYALSYVFFAACGGELRKLPQANPERDFPLGCFRPGTDEQLGSDDFMHGYYPIYVFDELRNTNPLIEGVSFGNGTTGAPCVDASACAQGEVCGAAGFCIPRVPRCTQDDEEDCPETYFKPHVPQSSMERGVVATLRAEDAPFENVWVQYHASGGTWKAGSQFLYDPDIGWQEEHEGYWRAPKVGGREVRLWAVVRDNRAGVSWIWRDVWVD